MKSIKIINPGLLTTVQDSGRRGYQQYGVSVAGVMDEYSFQLGNILVGNNRNAAALEITMLGPTIEFESNFAIAVTGGKSVITINDRQVHMNKTIYVVKGDVLNFSAIKEGFRSYLSISGGIKVPQIMGSSSTYLRGKMGGYEGRKLISGDIIDVNELNNDNYIGIRKIPVEMMMEFQEKNVFKVIEGPEINMFTQKGISSFFSSEYVLTSQSDRMGYRLDGEKIEHKDSADIISSGVTMGAVQVPGHGNPIIMMADRQTTGGYTKIANVISCDIPKLAQLKPGNKLSFKKITIEKAQELIGEREDKILNLISCFEKNDKNSLPEAKYFSININDSQFNIMVQESE